MPCQSPANYLVLILLLLSGHLCAIKAWKSCFNHLTPEGKLVNILAILLIQFNICLQGSLPQAYACILNINRDSLMQLQPLPDATCRLLWSFQSCWLLLIMGPCISDQITFQQRLDHGSLLRNILTILQLFYSHFQLLSLLTYVCDSISKVTVTDIASLFYCWQAVKLSLCTLILQGSKHFGHWPGYGYLCGSAHIRPCSDPYPFIQKKVRSRGSHGYKKRNSDAFKGNLIIVIQQGSHSREVVTT